MPHDVDRKVIHPSPHLLEEAAKSAQQIVKIPRTIVESFARRSVKERVAYVSGITTPIEIGLFPVFDWFERHEKTEASELLKRRVLFVIDEAIACVQYEIPEYATGEPQSVSAHPSEGAERTARLVVTARFTAMSLLQWANEHRSSNHDGHKNRKSSQPARKRTPKGEIPVWLIEAMSLRSKHPENIMSDAAIAERVNIHPGTLCKHPLYQAHKENVRAESAGQTPGGFMKTATEDGPDLEASETVCPYCQRNNRGVTHCIECGTSLPTGRKRNA